MNYIVLSIVFIYAIITGYFFYKFFKNNYSLTETILSIKQDLKKIFPCCIDKKNVAEKLSPEKAESLSKEMEKLNETENCKEPFGIPLDICLDGNLTKEELLIKEKVLNIVNKKNFKVKNGGKDKLVLPMEAVLFLTKNLNPLVSEHGEITIKMTGDYQQKQNSVPNEELEKLIIELQDKESVLYKDDEELINSINKLLKYKKIDFNNKIEVSEKEPIIIKEEPVKEIKPEIIIKKEEIIIDKKQGSEEDITLDKLQGPDEDIYQSKEEIKFEKIEEVKPQIISTPYDDDIEEITDFSSLNDQFNSDLDINDLLMQELDSIVLEEEESKSETKEEFYKKIDYKTVKNAELDFTNIENSISVLFSKEEAINALFRNMAKAQPIIFNGNKTVCIIDQNILLFAISKMFGMESKTYIEQFQKLGKDVLKKINSILEEKLELYLSDLLSGSKKANFYLIKDTNGNQYYSFGFVFQTNAFKTSFNSEKFDYFRSFPYNNKYEFVKKASVEETKVSSKLILDIKDVEIK